MKKLGKVFAVVAGIVVIGGLVGERDSDKRDVEVVVETKAPQNNINSNNSTEKIKEERSKKEQKKQVSTPKPTKKPKKKSTNKNKEKTSINDIVREIQGMAESRFDYASVYYDSSMNAVIVKITNNGIVVGASQAFSNKKLKKQWINLTNQVDNLCSVVKAALNKNGYKDVDAMVQVLNDMNLDNSLIISFNGKREYDAVQGVGF